MRPTDPIAERLLGLVLRLESAPWPRAQRAYARGLRALASRCDAPAAKAEIYRWLVREAGGALAGEDAAHRETLRDALHDAIARAPELLTRFHAGLDPERRPNLRSMLVRWIHWRAGNLRCAERRYAGRRWPLLVDDRPTPTRAEAVVELREVLALLDAGSPRCRALWLVGLGHSIMAAARLTGASRQQIYRARDTLRAAHGAGGGAEPGPDGSAGHRGRRAPSEDDGS